MKKIMTSRTSHLTGATMTDKMMDKVSNSVIEDLKCYNKIYTSLIDGSIAAVCYQNDYTLTDKQKQEVKNKVLKAFHSRGVKSASV